MACRAEDPVSWRPYFAHFSGKTADFRDKTRTKGRLDCVFGRSCVGLSFICNILTLHTLVSKVQGVGHAPSDPDSVRFDLGKRAPLLARNTAQLSVLPLCSGVDELSAMIESERTRDETSGFVKEVC